MHEADDLSVVVMNSMQEWHPDRWSRTPSLLGEAKRKFQQIQEAYSGICGSWIGILGSCLEFFMVLFVLL